jgi:UDP-2,4-diacetamido-2,4,6-trideoxy-beta-L-altropyranose hydrolase
MKPACRFGVNLSLPKHKQLSVAMRADFSSRIGFGHAKRCLALAEALSAMGALVYLVYRDLGIAGSLLGARTNVRPIVLDMPGGNVTVEDNGFQHEKWAGVSWSEDANETIEKLTGLEIGWIVVDHYAFDSKWHDTVARSLHVRIAVIDDLGDRSLSADVLIDQNVSDDYSRKYRDRIASRTRLLFGPRFALLSQDYSAAPRYQFKQRVESIGIFMGGIDADNISEVAARAAREEAGFGGEIEIVTTGANPNLHKLDRLARELPGIVLATDLPSLANFFSRHDLQVGAGGGATWERACIGAPTLALSLAENQEFVIPYLLAKGVVAAERSLNVADLGRGILALLHDPVKRSEMAKRGRRLVDGFGSTRVAAYLSADTLRLREAKFEDAGFMYGWRHDIDTRSNSSDSSEFSFDEHVQWLRRSLLNNDRILFVGTLGAVPIGVVRFDRASSLEHEVSIYLDPHLHGLGLGAILLRCAEAALFERCGVDTRILATVMEANHASRRLFEAAGYRKIGDKWTKSATH